MMNSARYTELIQPTIIRDMQRAFPEGGGYSNKTLHHPYVQASEESFSSG